MSASADDSTSNTLMVDEGNDDTEMGPWKEVHQQLINAVIISKDAIAIQKAQRRYWLTEINANLTEDGKLTATSVWKRPGKKRGRAPGSKTTKPKKTVKPKPKAKTAKLDADGNPVKKRKYTKRKKPEEEPAVATAASAVEEEAAVAAAAAAVQKAAAVGEDDSDDDDDDSDEDLESSKPPAKKLRLSLNIKNPASEEAPQGDDETEDEDGEDDDDMPEESFLGASGGSALVRSRLYEMSSGRIAQCFILLMRANG